MTSLDLALSLAARGWFVLPVDAVEKRPLGQLVQNGHHGATTDAETIRGWWAARPDARPAIALEQSGLVALDVEGPAKTPDGATSVRALADDLIATTAQPTPSGGAHLLYRRTDEAQARRLIRWKPGIDLLGKGYVLAYGQLAGEPAPLPPLLRQAFTARPSEKRSESAGEAEDHDFEPASPELLAYAHHLAIAHGPKAKGEGGNQHAYALGALLRHDLALSPEEARPILLAWRDAFPETQGWREDYLLETAENAVRYATTARGARRGELGVIMAAMEALSPPAAKPAGDLHVRIGEAAARERPPIRTYPTGLTDLDRLLGGGLSTRQLMVLGAPPGDGKSALAVTLSLTLEATLPVLYVSTELEAEEIVARVAAQVLGVSWRDIVRGRVDQMRVRAALHSKRIYVVGCDVLPRGDDALRAVVASAQAIAAAEGVPPFVIVDYMQDLARGGDEKSLRSRVGEIATMLRAMSQVLDCPLLAVCSVSRSYYGKAKSEGARGSDDATAYLAAMKESGDVDYAAATVLFLDVEPPVDGVRLARIAVAKARHGEIGFAGARFHGATGRWEADGAAAVALAPAERAKSRQASEGASVEKAVLAFVKSRPHGTVNSSSLRSNVEPHSVKVDHAAQRLVDAGVLDKIPGPRSSWIYLVRQPA